MMYNVAICMVSTLNSTKRTCQPNLAGENSSFIFAVYVKSVSLSHSQLAYVVLHVAVNFSKATSKNEESF